MNGEEMLQLFIIHPYCVELQGKSHTLSSKPLLRRKNRILWKSNLLHQNTLGNLGVVYGVCTNNITSRGLLETYSFLTWTRQER